MLLLSSHGASVNTCRHFLHVVPLSTHNVVPSSFDFLLSIQEQRATAEAPVCT